MAATTRMPLSRGRHRLRRRLLRLNPFPNMSADMPRDGGPGISLELFFAFQLGGISVVSPSFGFLYVNDGGALHRA